MKLPKKLGLCPLVDALIEIRFTSSLSRGAVFGFIYSIIKDPYKGKVINLPLSQIPEQVRDNDPNLQFKPIYRIEGDSTIIQLGPDVFSISSKMPYIGWDVLSDTAVDIFAKLHGANAIDTVIRLGHRYINLFEGNIDDKLNLSVNFVNNYQPSTIQLRSEIIDGPFTSTLQYSNAAILQNNLVQQPNGSIIDIDTFRVYNDNFFLDNIKSELDSAHRCEKELFYSLLKKEFIDSLSPIY